MASVQRRRCKINAAALTRDSPVAVLSTMAMKYSHFRYLILIAFQFFCVAPTTPSWGWAGSSDKEWAVVQRLLEGIRGTTTVPPANLITTKYTSGGLIGNGDVGVIVGDTGASQQSFHFGKSDFWGARRPVRHNDPECTWACRVSILSLGMMTISSPVKSNDTDRV